MFVDSEVFGAGPAMKLRAAFHFTTHPAMGTDHLSFHSAASCLLNRATAEYHSGYTRYSLRRQTHFWLQ
jgi:hypothetical protein